MIPALDTPLGAVIAEARLAAGEDHNDTHEDDGFVVCACGTPLPSHDEWAAHYADAAVDDVLHAVFAVLDNSPRHIVRFTVDHTVGLLSAHFETEHPDDWDPDDPHVELELVWTGEGPAPEVPEQFRS